MFKSVVGLVIAIFLVDTGNAWQAQSETQTRANEESGRFVSPAELNVRIEADVRTFVVMAAVNIAGYDYETGGQSLSPVRQQLRRDLVQVNPQLKAALAEFIKAHRRPGSDEASDASRYAALSLLMTQPPSFSIYQRDESTIPEDLRPLANERFLSLIRQFYTTSGIKELIPKYMEVGKAFSTAYRRPVGSLIYDILEYLHARPQPTIAMRPLVLSSGQPGAGTGSGKQNIVARTRTRHVFVIPELLMPSESAFIRDDLLNQKEELIYRRVGDDYIVVVGPSRNFHGEAVRRTLIRFMIDPIIERHLRTSLEYKEPIVKLVASVPTAQKPFGSSVYLVIRESLAVATEARMRIIEAKQGGGSYTEDDAVFDMSQAYLRGAVLVFHFYESLLGLEKVGINIEDFFDQMLATAKFERETGRPKEFEPVVARVTARRSSAGKKESNESAKAATANTLTGKILLSDDLIRQRRFGDARDILSEILKLEPKNARALYGMAQVISQMASPAEADPNADDNDKIQAQHERLEQAIKLYRGAIENASAAEKWLMQWSHVLIGRILDFQDFRSDAIVEYEKAIALGSIENGAYKEALEGKQRPHGHK